jgi:hypothetical protein
MKKDYSIRLMNEAGSGDGGGGAGVTDSSPASVSPSDSGGTALGGGASVSAASSEPAQPSVSIPENWKDALPEDLRGDPSLGPINNLEALAKSYIHSQKMIGRGKMSVPDEHATEDDWNQVYRQLGLPEKFEDYQFEEPEEHQFEDGFLTKLKEVGFKNGILPKQMKGLVDWYNDANNQALKNMEEQQRVQQQESMQKLKQEWGQAFDQRLRMAQAAIKATNMSEEVNDWLNATGLGDDPMMLKLIGAFGQMLKEDGLVGEFGDQVKSPKELESRVEELQQSKAYMDAAHPNHKKVIKELQVLFQEMHPTKSQSQGLLT